MTAARAVLLRTAAVRTAAVRQMRQAWKSWRLEGPFWGITRGMMPRRRGVTASPTHPISTRCVVSPGGSVHSFREQRREGCLPRRADSTRIGNKTWRGERHVYLSLDHGTRAHLGPQVGSEEEQQQTNTTVCNVLRSLGDFWKPGVRVCVCACVRARVCVCVRARVRVRVCARARVRGRQPTG